MGENKTQVTGVSADDFIAAVEHPVRLQDALGLRTLMTELTGQEPEMWGPTIVGFGTVHYKYATGREGDTAAVGFSPRKASLSLYGLTNAPESAALLDRLGKHKTGAGCLYYQQAGRRRGSRAGRTDQHRLPLRDHSPAPAGRQPDEILPVMTKPPPSASRRNPTAGAVSSSGLRSRSDKCRTYYLPATTSSSITAATSSCRRTLAW
jgi:hypothetical protein